MSDQLNAGSNSTKDQRPDPSHGHTNPGKGSKLLSLGVVVMFGLLAISLLNVISEIANNPSAAEFAVNMLQDPAESPVTPQLLRMRAAIEYDTGNFQRAVENYTEIIKLQPNDAAAYLARGHARSGLADVIGTIADCDQAIKLKPDYAEAYESRGNARSALGHYQAAIADYDQAIKFKPDYAAAYSNRAAALKDLADPNGAISDWQKAASLFQAQGNTDHYQRTLENIKQLQG
jgi:tetratricopeptide (TPR) repeat protein